jgi:uncharacterized protein Yka (UPF0111/DUF47 family)
LKLIEGIEFLVDEKFENFTQNLNYVIEANTEVRIKKTFESKIFKSKLMFSKADRLKLFNKINDIKNIGEYFANKMLLYKAVFEWQMLNRLYNYDMDYLSRTFLYLKELIENIMMLADHIKSFSEYIQFLAIKYLIFD